MKNRPLISVVIPARNEFPNIIHSIYSIVHCLETDGFTYKDFEIIVMDNASDDDEYPRKGNSGTTNYIMPRGIYWSRILRVIRDPICGNHSTRNIGAKYALGKYLWMSDAHMTYKPGFIKNAIKTVDETGGMVHGVIGWMGAYPPNPSGLGYQYTIKLGEEIKGTWNNYCLSQDKWFYIPALGHCSVVVRRDQFLKFNGYPGLNDSKAHLSTYGGGEFFLDMKWWMFGSTVAVHPQAIGYHLASSRGYSYNHDDYIKNVLAIGYALGMDDWRERTYINCLRKGRKEVLDRLMAESAIAMKGERKFIDKYKKKTFNEVLVEQPWNKMNMARLGRKNGGISIFHPSWLELMQQAPEYVKKIYRESKLQRGLEKFIIDNLWSNVYKKDLYDKENLPTV